jgi:peptidoglycan/xylan/chitin deacetylase (PgdA/CDA1 family)
MNWRRVIARGISEASVMGGLCSAPRKGLRILLYHSIGAPVNGDKKDIFCLSAQLFEEQMAELSNHNSFETISLPRVSTLEEMHGVAVTFDDGYKDNLSVAAPILEKYKIPFTVFATTSYIREGAFPFLSETELRFLSENPLVTIGSHGVTHLPLTDYNDRALKNELESSKHYLEDLTGKEISMISYPHGRVNKRVRDAVESTGYKLGASSFFNVNNVSTDLLMLSRTCIFGKDSVRIFRQKLYGDWDWYRWWQSLSMRS